MIRYHFDLYPRDDPRDGTRVVRFTKLQQAEYRGEANGTGAGRLSIRADVAEAQLIDPRGLQYVRVVREDTVAVTELVVGGFWLETGDFSLLDSQGTRLLSFGGAGTLAYLSRAVMASHTYISPIFTGQDPFDDVWRLYAQSTFYANGNYLGAMLWRVLYEATHNVPGTHRHANGIDVSHTHADDRPAIAIPDLVMDFDAFVDTEGNDWTLSSGEFKAQVGENVLAVVKRLMEAGLYVQMDPDTFELRAWQGRPASRLSRSTDRTGGAWATGVVRFQAPVGEDIDTGNIKSDAKRAIAAFIKRSWLLAGGNDVYGDATGGSDVPWEGFYYADVNDVDAAANVAAVQITARDDAGDTLRLRGKLGDSQSTGQYKPFEHALLDDLVTVHTGTDQFDHDEQDFPIAAITINLRPGGDWDVWYDLGSSYSANPSRQFQVAPVPAHNHPPNLCIPGTEGSITSSRLYPSLSASGSGSGESAAGPALDGSQADAGWDTVELSQYLYMYDTPQGSSPGASPAKSWSGVNEPAGDVALVGLVHILNGGLLSSVQSGGVLFGQHRMKSRHGVGVDENAQQNFSTFSARVYRPGSGFVATLVDVGDSVGVVRFEPSTNGINNSFGPVTITPYASAVSGDFLVIDLGTRHVGPTSGATGAGVFITDTEATDYGVDSSDQLLKNSWWQLESTVGGTPNDGHIDLVGTSNRASRCDHGHDVHRDRAPTPSDDETQGYTVRTIWAHLDDLENPTAILGLWRLVDATEGAAIWLPESSTDHGHDAGDITGYPVSTVVDHGTMGASEEFDFVDGSDHEGILDENLTITLSTTTSGEAAFLTLVLTQDGTGTNTLTLPASVVNGSDVETNFDTAADAVNIITLFTYDGGTTWYGFLAGGSSGGASALDDLTDVTITGAAEHDTLRHDGSGWVNESTRWEPVTFNFGSGPELVWDGDDLVMEWKDY
jgi:hypothetical protein